MKKNIVNAGLVVLSFLLVSTILIGVFKTQQLNRVLQHEKEVQSQTLTRDKREQKQVKTFQTKYSQLKNQKNNFVIQDMTENVNQFFEDAFNYSADEDTSKTREADAKQLAVPDVVKYFFEDGQELFVDSEARNLKVYVESTDQSITSGLVCFTLHSGVADMVKETIFTYQFSYDASSKRLIKVDGMKRYMADLLNDDE
jgi:hypothetical protein